MPVLVRDDDAWSAPLTIPALVTFSRAAVLLFDRSCDTPSTFHAELGLADGTSLVADSVDELLSDLDSAGDVDATDMSIQIERPGVMSAVNARNVLEASQPCVTMLRSTGIDATSVYGLHAQLRRRLDRCLTHETPVGRTEHPAPEPHSADVHIGAIAGDVDVIAGASSSVAARLVTESAASPATLDEEPWWLNSWLVTIGGGIVVIVAGLLMAHVL